MPDNFRNFDDNDLAVRAEREELRRQNRSRAWRRIKAGMGYVAVIGSIIGGFGGCTYAMANNQCANYEYRFKGELGGEQVQFHESWTGSWNYLDVVKQDGTEYHFVSGGPDLGVSCGNESDFILTSLEVKTAKTDVTYIANSGSAKVEEMIAIGQTMYDDYLKKIFEANSAPLKVDR